MDIFTDIQNCQKCKLHHNRTHVVFGRGADTAKIMIIGEAPGHDEDIQGVPFVGRAGQLLDILLERAGIRYGDIYIANILKCRPPGNRDPEPDEIQACFPYLKRQIELLSPRVIITLGRYATSRLTGRWATMGDFLGVSELYTGEDIQNIPVIAQYHPAYLLRQGRPNTDKPKAKAIFQDFVERLRHAKKIAE